MTERRIVMSRKHTISIAVENENGKRQPVMTSRAVHLRERLVTWLLGPRLQVLVVTPEEKGTVVSVQEITERK